MRILGIDPGINGGLAVLEFEIDARGFELPQVMGAIDVPTSGDGSKRRVNGKALFDWICGLQPTHAFLENVNAMPQQGVSSGFRFGRAAGAIEGVVQCCGIPYTLIVPRKWKEFHGLAGPDKEQGRQRAIQLLPASAGLFALKKDHNAAEAALIALYGRSTFARKS